MSATTPVLPPRKRDWKKGTHQLGLFVRFPDGAVIEVSSHTCTPSEIAAALSFLKLLTRSDAERAQEPTIEDLT